MNSISKLFRKDVPTSWAGAILRSAIVAVVAFIVLQAKELVDAGTLDTPATAVDGLLIAGAYLVVNAVFMILTKSNSGRRSAQWQSD
jgi:hypothetical protein